MSVTISRSGEDADLAAFLSKMELIEARLDPQWSQHRLSLPWMRAGYEVAWQLYPAHRLARTARGSVILKMSNGKFLLLAADQADLFNAEARKFFGNFRASISVGGLKALYELCCALWLDRRICPELGRLEELPPLPRVHADIPRGLEHLWATVSDPNDRKPLAERRLLPVWLRETFPLVLKSGREQAFAVSFLSGVRFLWMHEIAHIVLGHVGTSFASNRTRKLKEMEAWSMSGPQSDEARSGAHMPRLLRQALEMQADRFALHHVLSSAQQAPSEASTNALVPKALGCIAVATLMHAGNVLLGRQDYAIEHPPIWFRATEVLRALDMLTSHCRDLEAGFRQVGGPRWDLMRVLVQAADIHPLFGDWMGGIADGAYTKATDRFETQALAFLQPYRHQQAASLSEITPRPPGQLPIDHLVFTDRTSSARP